MADYRAMNRNSKFVDVRKKLATKFSTPAPKFTPGGRPGVVSTPNPVAGAGTNFLDQMGKRYTINTVKGIKDVVEGTISNNSKGFQNNALIDQPAWLGLLPGVGQLATAGNYGLGNLINNEAASDAVAPLDFVGAGGPLKGAASVAAKVVKPIVPVLTSKASKFATAASAAIAASGFANSDKANAFPTSGVLKTGKLLPEGVWAMPMDELSRLASTIEQATKATQGYVADPEGLARLYTGGDTPDPGIISWVKRNLGTSDTSFKVPTTPEGKIRSVRQGLENTAKNAVDTRQPNQLEELNATLATTSHGTQLNPVRRPISMANAEEALAIAEQTHGIAASASGFANKAHVMENDHFIGSSFITDYINRAAGKVTQAGGKLSKDWVDQHNALIDWANSADNMARVGRFWNQVKSGKDFDTAMKEFGDKYPIAAKQQFHDAYLEHTKEAGDSLLRSLGTSFGTNVLADWRDPARNAAVRAADMDSSKRKF